MNNTETTFVSTTGRVTANRKGLVFEQGSFSGNKMNYEELETLDDFICQFADLPTYVYEALDENFKTDDDIDRLWEEIHNQHEAIKNGNEPEDFSINGLNFKVKSEMKEYTKDGASHSFRQTKASIIFDEEDFFGGISVKPNFSGKKPDGFRMTGWYMPNGKTVYARNPVEFPVTEKQEFVDLPTATIISIADQKVGNGWSLDQVVLRTVEGGNEIIMKAWQKSTHLIEGLNIGDRITVISAFAEPNDQYSFLPSLVLWTTEKGSSQIIVEGKASKTTQTELEG